MLDYNKDSLYSETNEDNYVPDKLFGPERKPGDLEYPDGTEISNGLSLPDHSVKQYFNDDFNPIFNPNNSIEGFSLLLKGHSSNDVTKEIDIVDGVPLFSSEPSEVINKLLRSRSLRNCGKISGKLILAELYNQYFSIHRGISWVGLTAGVIKYRNIPVAEFRFDSEWKYTRDFCLTSSGVKTMVFDTGDFKNNYIW